MDKSFDINLINRSGLTDTTSFVTISMLIFLIIIIVLAIISFKVNLENKKTAKEASISKNYSGRGF